MKVRIIYKFPWFWGKYWGITLYPFILFKYRKKFVTERMFRHEWEHVRQIRDLGWFKFHWQYLKELLKKGYTDNKFEVAARRVENLKLTPKQRRTFTLGKEV